MDAEGLYAEGERLYGGWTAVTMARDAEIADLRAQLAANDQGEFAWAAFADSGNVIIWSRRRSEVEPVAAKYGKPVVPVVYLAAPAIAQPADANSSNNSSSSTGAAEGQDSANNGAEGEKNAN
jgi:hypothetical protein